MVLQVHEQTPVVDPQLVEHLRSIFPDRCPHPRWTEREVWMAVGSATVVTYLSALVAQQEENILNVPTPA